MLGISQSILYSMVRSNEIHHSKIRGRIILHYPILEEWIMNGASKESGSVTNFKNNIESS